MKLHIYSQTSTVIANQYRSRNYITRAFHLAVRRFAINGPDSKVHGANMGPTWVLSAPDGPHVGPMNLAIRGYIAMVLGVTIITSRWYSTCASTILLPKFLAKFQSDQSTRKLNISHRLEILCDLVVRPLSAQWIDRGPCKVTCLTACISIYRWFNTRQK